MDCSLSTWPSITQFDDFVWTGLGDIDLLENLEGTKNNDRELSGPATLKLRDTKPSSLCDNNNAQNMHSQRVDFYTLSPSESLVAGRWESINAVDLASVLDTAFPSEGVSSFPTTEDRYDLYSGDMLMQPEQQLGGEVDVFTVDPMSEVVDAITATLSSDDVLSDTTSVLCDSTALPSSQDQMECKCNTVDVDTSGLINPSMYGESTDDTHGSMRCKVQRIDVSEVLNSNPSQPGDILGYYPPGPPKLAESKNPCTFNQRELSDLKDIQSGITIQWPTSQLGPMRGPTFDGGKLVHRDGYPGTISAKVELAGAARLSSEIKLNRAQASRARRLTASQRRAEGRLKKHPLQKLIRMSSSSSCTRDRLGHNLAALLPMLHSPVHTVSQTHLPGGGLSLPMSTVSPQIPTFLPAVFQVPQMVSSHEVHTHINPVQVGPRYSYQHQQLVACSEDSNLSSGSSVARFPSVQQAMQSLTMAPALGLPSSTNSAESLDATLLEQLQSVLNKMNGEMRLCIRDALYRLARSANQRQNRVKNASYSDSSSSHIEAVETQTNSLDRWIVNLLFCKQPSVPEGKPQSYSPIPSDATSQSVWESANRSSISQQWNSCGSFLNLQDQPLHLLTG